MAQGDPGPGTIAWNGDWHWPMRVALLADDAVDAESLLRKFRSASHIRRNLADVGLFGRDFDGADILLVVGTPNQHRLKALAGRIGAIVYCDLKGPRATQAKLQEIAHDAGAAVAAQINLAEEDSAAWLNEFVANLSHGDPLAIALTKSTQETSLFCEPQFCDESIIRTAIGNLADRIELTPEPGRIVFPKISADTFRLPMDAPRLEDLMPEMAPSVDAELTGPLVANVIREKSNDFGFLQETHEATGVAALNASVTDAETGPRIRSADVTIFRDDGEARVAGAERLIPGQTYRLEFAFRAQRSGIGFDQEITPLRSSSKSRATLHVALAIGPGCEGEIADAVATIELPPDGDSTEAWFTFKPTRADNEIFRLCIRVYYRLNLLEHVVVESGYGTAPMHRVLQPEQFRRHEGDLAEVFAPARLSIDIGEAPQYRLTIASPDEGGLELTALPTIGGEGLRTAIGEVRELWLEVAFDAFASGVKASSAASAQEQLRALAKKGRELWSMLFERGNVGGEARQVGNALRDANFSPNAIIQINVGNSARPFVFPWTMLYDRDVPVSGDVDPDGFWGMRFNIEQRPTTPFRRQSVRGLSDAVTASLFLDRRIGQSNGQDKLAEDLAQAASTRLSLRETVESGAGFEKALEQGQDDLLYFFCHGMTHLDSGGLLEALRGYVRQRRTGGPSVVTEKLQWVLSNKALQGGGTALQLTRSVIYLNDLWPGARPLEREPIVILNMCESAQLLPDLANSFVQYFLSCNASAVIGTECVIPADFGAAFGCELLPRLLEDTPVGAALLGARRKMMCEFSNPLGLAYTLWGGADARLKPIALPAGADKYYYKEGSSYVGIS